MKRLSAIILIFMATILLFACSSDSTTKKIGVSQFVEHPSLDEAYQGFKDALEESDLEVEYDFQSAQGDFNNVNTIAQNFVADEVDLIFANATPSALGALQEAGDTDIPILFTSVTDAVEVGLMEAMDQPDTVTGVVDLHPESIVKTVEFIEKYFDGATIGLIYNAGEQNSVIQVEAVNEAVAGKNLTTVERTVANSSEVHQAANSLVGDADVFYIVTDNTAVSALESIIDVANEQQMPLIVSETESLEKGGFATYGINYYEIGYRTGEMAVEILSGEKEPQDIPAEYPQEIILFINKTAAEAQGIQWNDEWDEIAEIIE